MLTIFVIEFRTINFMTTQTNCIACNNRLASSVQSRVGILCDFCKSQGLFRKRIIITGITRMNRGHICVSGIDPDTWRFVRPVFSTGLGRNFVINGSAHQIKHFSIVELELKKYSPSIEFHTEDWIINENFAPRLVGQLNNIQLTTLLQRMSVDNLNEAIQRKDSSLFIIKAKRILDLYHEYSFGKFKVRLTFEDWGGNIHHSLPATDLLLLAMVRYKVEVQKCAYSDQLIRQFNSNPFKYIRIGLTREFLGQHWRQITGLITVPDLFGGESFIDYEKKLGMCA